METIKLTTEDPGLEPGDLIAVAYGGAGHIWPGVFLTSYKSASGNLMLRYVGLQTNAILEGLTAKWLWRESCYILGENIQHRVVYIHTNSLTSQQRLNYDKLKTAICNEYQDNRSADPVQQ
jgi:hypothetical protein